MSNGLELNGRRALVTGGTKGVGHAVVATLRSAGARVLTTARSQPDILTDPDLFVAADVSTASGCAIVAQAVEERLGVIDIIVHVVGGSSAPAGGYAVLDDDEWDKALAQNLFAAVRLDRALMPAMVEQRSGVIVHVTSIQRQLPLPEATIAYAAAKAALANYSKGLSKEGRPRGAGFAGLGRDGRRLRPHDRNREANRHRLRGRQADRHELSWRHPVGSSCQTERGSRAGSITGTEYVIDGGTVPTV